MVKKEYQIIAKNYDLAGRASSDIKRTLKQFNLEYHLAKKICAASYEAEINVVIHSFGGYAVFSMDEDKVVLDYFDDGPGIEDIELAMKEGYSTACEVAHMNGFGAGMGLSNIQQSADQLHIESGPLGTHLNMIFWLKERHEHS